MSFSGLALNQAVSYGNLQDAVNNGIYTLKSTIPSPANRESTKSVVSSTISGFNPNYPPYVIKANNELIVKKDIYVTGNVTLSPANGMYFTGITATGFPSFSYPVDHLVAADYVNKIPAQTFIVYLNGTRDSTPLNITLYIDTTKISCQNITQDGSQSFSFTLPNIVYAPSSIFIQIDAGACAVTPITFNNKNMGGVTVNRGSGQYMLAISSNLNSSGQFIKGYIYRSSNYGSSWTTITSAYDYWTNVKNSDNGQYVIATTEISYNYISSDYGVTFSPITSLGQTGGGSIALSSTGQYQMLITNGVNGYTFGVYNSSDYGSTWTKLSFPIPNLKNINGCAIDSSGSTYLISGSVIYSDQTYDDAYILRSTDHGATWQTQYTKRGVYASLGFMAITASSGWAITCQPFVLSANTPTRTLLKSSNSGVTWSDVSGSEFYFQQAINTSNGTTAWSTIHSEDTNLHYLQKTGSGVSGVSSVTAAGNRYWNNISNSDDGNYILSSATPGLFLSTNGGVSWTSL